MAAANGFAANVLFLLQMSYFAAYDLLQIVVLQMEKKLLQMVLLQMT